MVITTHSPYVLNCINTLCYAGKMTCENGKTKVDNLIMQQEQELYIELIDEVSDINNEMYTRLYEVEVQD